jgi:CSLREA domain-containing protein
MTRRPSVRSGSGSGTHPTRSLRGVLHSPRMHLASVRLLAVATCAAGLALLPAAAEAAIFPVTTTADIGDATPDGACNHGPGGTCPLREAVDEANSALRPADDTIELAPGTYSFAPGAPPLTEAFYNGKLTIVGGTARDTTIDGADQGTIFTIATGGSLELRDLTLRNGKTDLVGGGIRNEGTLVLLDMALVSNEAKAGGGAVSSTGTLEADRVTFFDNRSNDTGGAVRVYRINGTNPGTATITNSTVGGNYSRGGGALMVAGGGTLGLQGSTVSGNSSGLDYSVGGVRVEDPGSKLLLANSIVSGNSKHDCLASVGGTVVSQGGNATGDDECVAGPVADPKLGPLQDNGGPTDTFALLAGSAAVDAATAPGCPAVDQRGVPRPVGACDAGAFERVVADTQQQPQQQQQQQQQQPPPPPPPPPPADVTAPAISNVFATRRVFAVNPRAAAAVRRRVSRGTTFRFTLSEAARTSLRIERNRRGRWVRVRTLFRNAAAGGNRVRFSGRVLVRGRARALRPGRYRVRLQAVDGAGNRSAQATIRFRIAPAVRSR